MLKIITALAVGTLVAGAIMAAPAQADELETIKKNGELSIALSGAYPPFSLINDKNEVVGFDVAIGTEIAKRLGVKPKIVTTAWDGILAGLIAGKYDTIIGSMSITPKRQEVVDFVGPYYSAGRMIFVPKDSGAKALDDLKGKTIGVTLGETHEKWANEKGGWTVKTYKGLPELLLELQNGRLDAIVIDSIPGQVAIRKSDAPIKAMELPGLEGGNVGVGIAIRKDNPDLAAAMQKALDDMMADGTYEKIAVEWVGADIR
jgi:polar amino acid transport system substrate-binding protein